MLVFSSIKKGYSKEKLIKLSNSLPQEISPHSSAVKLVQLDLIGLNYTHKDYVGL